MNFLGMHVAVTGATGHIGSNLCRILSEGDHSFVALYHTQLEAAEKLPDSIRWKSCDILELKTLKEVFSGADIVVHLAAMISQEGDPDGKVMQTNVEGTKNVVRACIDCGVQKLVHFSSIHAFSNKSRNLEITETSPKVGPEAFPYDLSKKLGEEEAWKATESGIDVVIINPTSVVGPEDFSPSLMGHFLIQVYNGKIPALVNGGYDWVDARDIARATIRCFSPEIRNTQYLLSGRWTSLAELTQVIQKVTGKSMPRFSVPIQLAMAGLPLLRGFSKLTGQKPLYTRESLTTLKNAPKNVSHQKASEELGYKPRSLEETISDTFKWLKRHHKI